MINGKKIVVVLPAYNAAKTLEMTFNEIDHDIVDDVILVDDYSHDHTVVIAQKLGLHILTHDQNKGYGANQKTCYKAALERKADIVIMLHPDYQYTPLLLPSMAYMIANDLYDCVLASRIIGKTNALKGGMPLYKYISNRFLTGIQNILIGAKLSEYHTGYRAFARNVLEGINYQDNSDDFVFDNEMLTQIHFQGYRIGEVSCPTKYFPEASTINFRRSVKYGIGVLLTSWKFFLHRKGFIKSRLFRV